MFSPLHFVFVFLLAVALSACGGGGGSEQSPSNSVGSDEQVKIVTKDAQISFDRNVSSETIDKIASVSSPFGSSPSPIALEIEDEGSLVVASDKDSNILLAGIVFGDNNPLNARSTAIALVDLLIINQDAALSRQDIISLIESNPDFSALLSLVQEQVDNALPVLEPDTIIALVREISAQVEDQISELASSQNLVAGTRKYELVTIQSLQLENELVAPYEVVQGRKTLTGGRANGSMTLNPNVELRNNIPTTFFVSQYSSEDLELVDSKVISSSNFSLDPFNLFAGLNKDQGFVETVLGLGKLQLQRDDSLRLVVEYNRDTRLIDAGLIVQKVLSQMVPYIEEVSQCGAEIVKVLIPSDKLVELSALGSFDAAMDELFGNDGYLITAFQKVANGTTALVNIPASCSVSEIVIDDGYLKATFKATKELLKKLELFNRVVSGVSLVGRIASVSYFWPQTKVADLTVCLDTNRQVANCAYGFNLSPARTPVGALAKPEFLDPAVIATGATIPANLSAFDKDDAETLLPISLGFKDKNNIDVSTGPLPARPRSIIAGDITGSGNITVTDIATDVSSTEYFNLINPVFHGDNDVTLNVDEEKTFRLVHPSQRDNAEDISDSSYDVFNMENGQFEFSSSDDSVQVIGQTSTNQLATVTVKGVSDGQATVTAKNKISGYEEMIEIYVELECEGAQPPVIQSVTRVCETGDTASLSFDFAFKNDVGGGLFGRMYFNSTTDQNSEHYWQHSDNGYGAGRIDGDQYEGTYRFRHYLPSLSSCEQTDFYSTEQEWFYKWKITLTNSCNLTADSNDFSFKYWSHVYW